MNIFDIFKRKDKVKPTFSEDGKIIDDHSPTYPTEYKIATIIGNNQHEYPKDECLLVLANNIVLNHRNVCDESIDFLLPISEWNHIVGISNNDWIWHPNMSEFTKDVIFFPGLAKGTWLKANSTVWKHRSVVGSDGRISIDTNNINEIPEWEYKIETLKSQYYNRGWYNMYPSFKRYVISLAEEDDVENFWGWLFDNSMLDGCNKYSIPQRYRALFRTFIQYCQD